MLSRNGAKGFAGGFGRHLLSSFGEAATKAFVAEGVQEALRLENAMRSAKSHRVLVILHYAPIIETVRGEPVEIFPFLGSSRLAETIDRFPVNAIVHSHAHHGAFEGRTPGGIPVFNVAKQIAKPGGRPFHVLELLPLAAIRSRGQPDRRSTPPRNSAAPIAAGLLRRRR